MEQAHSTFWKIIARNHQLCEFCIIWDLPVYLPVYHLLHSCGLTVKVHSPQHRRKTSRWISSVCIHRYRTVVFLFNLFLFLITYSLCKQPQDRVDFIFAARVCVCDYSRRILLKIWTWPRWVSAPPHQTSLLSLLQQKKRKTITVVSVTPQ